MAQDKPEPWKPPRTYAEIWDAFSAKHGNTPDTRKIHDKWVQLAREVGVVDR